MGKRGLSGGSRAVAARQRLGGPAAPAEVVGGNLARLLLEKRAWGLLPSTVVQQLAEAAVADGAVCPFLRKLATIGNSGLASQNCDRDLDHCTLMYWIA